MKAVKTSGSSGKQLARQADQAARLLRVMSNGHRLRVLCLLRDGEMSVGQLNELIDVSQSVLSQHLAVLRSLQLVKTRRVSQTIYYRVTPGPATRVIAALYTGYLGRRPIRGDRHA